MMAPDEFRGGAAEPGGLAVEALHAIVGALVATAISIGIAVLLAVAVLA